jgi:hypothetical protein
MMTLTQDQILTADVKTLWPAVCKHAGFELREALGYAYEPGPQQWHGSLDADGLESVDLTVMDCGSTIREAAFVQAMFYASAERGMLLSTAQTRLEDIWAEPYLGPEYQARMTYPQMHPIKADSLAVACLRAYLLAVETHP